MVLSRQSGPVNPLQGQFGGSPRTHRSGFSCPILGVLHIRSSPFVRLALLRSLPQRRRIMPEKSPAKPLSARCGSRGAGRRYNPFSSSESVVSRAEAILLRVRSPGSRAPRSKSEICTSWTPDCSARSICRQFRARRNFLIRSPVAAQMSFAMRSSSD